jgi:hypothetical protein
MLFNKLFSIIACFAMVGIMHSYAYAQGSQSKVIVIKSTYTSALGEVSDQYYFLPSGITGQKDSVAEHIESLVHYWGGQELHLVLPAQYAIMCCSDQIKSEQEVKKADREAYNSQYGLLSSFKPAENNEFDFIGKKKWKGVWYIISFIEGNISVCACGANEHIKHLTNKLILSHASDIKDLDSTERMVIVNKIITSTSPTFKLGKRSRKALKNHADAEKRHR